MHALQNAKHLITVLEHLCVFLLLQVKSIWGWISNPALQVTHNKYVHNIATHIYPL